MATFALPTTLGKFKGLFIADKHNKIQVLRGFRAALPEILPLVDVVFLEAFCFDGTFLVDLHSYDLTTIISEIKAKGFDHHPDMADEYRQIIAAIGAAGKKAVGVDTPGDKFLRTSTKWNNDHWVADIKKYMNKFGFTNLALFGGGMHSKGLTSPMNMPFSGYEWNSASKQWTSLSMGTAPTDCIYKVASGPLRNASKRLVCCECVTNHQNQAAISSAHSTTVNIPSSGPSTTKKVEPGVHGKMPGLFYWWHVCNRCESAYCPTHGSKLSGKRGFADSTRDCGQCTPAARTTLVAW